MLDHERFMKGTFRRFPYVSTLQARPEPTYVDVRVDPQGDDPRRQLQFVHGVGLELENEPTWQQSCLLQSAIVDAADFIHDAVAVQLEVDVLLRRLSSSGS